jgi:cytochrome c-type biogenesis protein CcmH/NrfG
MSTAAIQLTEQNVAPAPLRLPAVPWRDPHTVSPEQLSSHIAMLERACEENPGSPDLRTCLGMAHAMNYDAYRSMDALEMARELDPNHFFAQLKYAELHYRLRALVKAERETLRAVELARNAWELSLSRRQLQEIRRLMREGTQKPEWSKSLTTPSVALALLLAVVFLAVVLR